jgi:hypothetical protein
MAARVATHKGFRPPKVVSLRPSGALDEKDPEELVVTPAYEEWLLKNPELTADPAAVRRVMEELLKPPRDRRRSFSASSAGYCLRRQELAFTGAKQNPIENPRTLRIFHNGTMVHVRWQIGLLSARILDDIEYDIVSRSGLSRATLDGLGVAVRGKYRGERFIWEHKGRMSWAFLAQSNKNSPDEKTLKQVDFQLLKSGYDLAVVTNENKDTQEIDEFVIERDEKRIEAAREELHELISAASRKRLHPMIPECVKQNVSGEFYKCPFGGPDGACVNTGRWPGR